MNTRIEYLYRDGSNYKRWGWVVFRGTCDAAVHRRLLSALDDDLFIADQVRIPELFFNDRPLYDDDHSWHEMGELATTSDSTDDQFDRAIEDFVAEVERASNDGWRVFDRSARITPPCDNHRTCGG